MRWRFPKHQGSSGFLSLRTRVCLVLALPALVGWITGCASTHFDGRSFRRGDVAFSVGETPAGWRSINVSDASLAYRDDGARATIAVQGRCARDGDDVPLESLTQHLFIHFTEREMVRQERMPMDGREAMRTEMVAKLDGVARRFIVYVLKKDGCVYDFLYIGEPEPLRASVGAFDRYVAGFRATQR